MKILNKIITFILISFSISCSKDEPQTIVDPVVMVPKVKTYTIGTTLYTLIYDTEGRLITRTSSNDSKEEYSYSPNKVECSIFLGTVLETTKMYDLNIDGLKIKSLRTFPATGNYQTVYTYNANKQLATLVNSNSLDTKTSTKTFFYEGKNLEHIEETFSYKPDNWKFYYTYFTDKINTFGNKNRGYLFDNEEQSENVVKTFTAVFSPTNTQVDTYTYEYDLQGRISKKFQNNVFQNEIVYY